MTKKDKEIIWDLFYEKCYWLYQIEEYFNNKYTERQIRSVIREKM